MLLCSLLVDGSFENIDDNSIRLICLPYPSPLPLIFDIPQFQESLPQEHSPEHRASTTHLEQSPWLPQQSRHP